MPHECAAVHFKQGLVGERAHVIQATAGVFAAECTALQPDATVVSVEVIDPAIGSGVNRHVLKGLVRALLRIQYAAGLLKIVRVGPGSGRERPGRLLVVAVIAHIGASERAAFKLKGAGRLGEYEHIVHHGGPARLAVTSLRNVAGLAKVQIVANIEHAGTAKRVQRLVRCGGAVANFQIVGDVVRAAGLRER